jgi:enoyl-CoA hydratase/carnithine racemase
MVAELSAGFSTCVREGARIVVFEGKGRHFCTGFDLSTLETESDASLLLRFVEIEKLLQQIHASPILTVAVGKGRCFGAGADLFASCDRRVALTGSSFCFPGAGFGLVLGTSRLAARIGRDNARACITTGAVLSDQLALSQKLATDIATEGELESLLVSLTAGADKLDAETAGMINSATDNAEYDRDLASLVRSASRSGLRDRIRAYRGRLKTN